MLHRGRHKYILMPRPACLPACHVPYLMPTFFPCFDVTDDGAAADAGSLPLAAPARVGPAFAFAVGRGIVGAVTGGAVCDDKAILRRVREGANFTFDCVIATHCLSHDDIDIFVYPDILGQPGGELGDRRCI